MRVRGRVTWDVRDDLWKVVVNAGKLGVSHPRQKLGSRGRVGPLSAAVKTGESGAKSGGAGDRVALGL